MFHKTVMLFVFVILSLSACADAPGIEMSSVPTEFIESQRTRIEVDKQEAFELDTISPPGDYIYNYILLRNLPTGRFSISVYMNQEEVCLFDKEISDPREFLVPQEHIYLVESNCSGLGDEVITWYVHENYATSRDDSLHIILLTGSQYYILELDSE